MKLLRHAIAFLITAVCLYLAFRGVDLREALAILEGERVRIFPLVLFSFLCMFVFLVRAWRWIYFYRPEHNATVGGLTIANFIGFSINNILPLRLGEVARALMARRKVKAPLSYTLATLFIERLFDLMCLLLCLILPLLIYSDFPPLIVKIGKIMFFVFLGAVGFLIVLRSKPHLAQKMALPVGRKVFSELLFERFSHFMQTFTEGLQILRNGPAMWKIILLSILHWWIVAYSYGLAFRGFSFDTLPWSAPYLTLGLVGLGVAVPSAPAFIGPLHVAIIYSLSSAYGIPKSEATGFAVVMHLLMMAPVTIVGLMLMWKEGLTLGQIREKAGHLEEELPESASV
jgi:uncharacterized protein (TIRG00374 family)